MPTKNLHLEPIAGPPLSALEVPSDRTFVIGRQSSCEGVLSDAAVSRRHAQIAFKAGTWLLTDLDSRHGTYVNGIRLGTHESSPMNDGDLLRLGPWTFRVGGPIASTLLQVTHDDTASTMNRVHRVPASELSLRAQHRLELLIDCAASITAATAEAQMADAVLEALIRGTGFPHAAFIRRIGTGDGNVQIELIASRGPQTPGAPTTTPEANARPSTSMSLVSVGPDGSRGSRLAEGGSSQHRVGVPRTGAGSIPPVTRESPPPAAPPPAPNQGVPPEPLSFSRSLIEAAAHGQVVRLDEAGVQDYGQSVVQLGIQAAICAPVMLDASPAAFLYLDARRPTTKPGFGFTRPAAWSIQPDAPAFCQAVARICGLALANLKRIELSRRQQQLEGDLDAAREVQRLIMPPPQGRLGPLSYALRSKPGRFVAGDLLDIFPLGENKAAVFLGDVSGKGIDAAILMATAQAHLNATLKHNPDPAAALTDVNHHMAGHITNGRFISLWLGVIDHAAESLTFVDAGHGHWLIKPQGQPAARVDSAGGFPVGIDAATRYVSDTIPFPRGTRLVLYSDGLVEQQSPEGEVFGIDRTVASLTSSTGAESDVAALFAALAHFAAPPVGGKAKTVDEIALADDVTVASIEVGES